MRVRESTMVKITESASPMVRPRRHRLHGDIADQIQAVSTHTTVDAEIGRCLRELRAKRNLSIRTLAEQSGLNVNTLSLIENSRTSPSVNTLQQLANALDVHITAFFKTDTPKNNILYQKVGQRPRTAFAHGTLEDLGAGMTLQGGQPFLVTLNQRQTVVQLPSSILGSN
jgi:transcriptional regulator with XRE-family HTH domain